MLGIILQPPLNLRIMTHGSVVLDAITDVDLGIDLLTNVAWKRLVNLLVGISVASMVA